MKFCQICGRPLQDNEVCNCQAQRQQAPEEMRTVAANQPPYQQPVAPQPQPQPQRPVAPQPQQRPVMPQQPYYAAQPVQKAPDGKFVKSLKNIPVVFKSYWTNSDKLEAAAKKGRDFILPLLFIAILFFVNLILGICYFARMTTPGYSSGLGMFSWVFASSGRGFQFGFVLLSALIITIFNACLYINFRFFSSLILSKKKPADAFMDALVEFGIHSMPVCLWLFLGSLLTLATCWLTVPFIGLAMAYYIVIGVSNTLKECGTTKNVFLRNLIISSFVMVGVALSTWMFYLCCQMNVGITSFI